MDSRISMIALGVSDPARAAGFYRRLGWQPSARGGGDLVLFQLAGGMVLALYPRDALAGEAGLPPPCGDAGFGGIVLAQNVLEPGEVERTLEQAVAAGGTLLKPAGKTSWGGYAGWFADPDGHAWEVVWNPALALQTDKALILPA